MIESAGQGGDSALRLNGARAEANEPAADPSAGLVISNVTKSWGERRVLRSVSLRVPPGVTAWVGGKNGVGKTTLLRIVAGLILAEEGDVKLDRLDPRLVMLDEPLNSLDEDGIALLCTALADLNSRGGAAIWCSPSPPELHEITRLYELRDGLLEERR